MQVSFETLKELASHIKPGMSFETTLLGDVSYEDKDGVYVGVIPTHLQHEANRHGLRIESADHRSGVYVLRFIEGA